MRRPGSVARGPHPAPFRVPRAIRPGEILARHTAPPAEKPPGPQAWAMKVRKVAAEGAAGVLVAVSLAAVLIGGAHRNEPPAPVTARPIAAPLPAQSALRPPAPPPPVTASSADPGEGSCTVPDVGDG